MCSTFPSQAAFSILQGVKHFAYAAFAAEIAKVITSGNCLLAGLRSSRDDNAKKSKSNGSLHWKDVNVVASAEKTVSSMLEISWIGIAATPDFGARQPSVNFDNAGRSATVTIAVECPANILGDGVPSGCAEWREDPIRPVSP